MNIEIITPPNAEPLALNDVLDALRIDHGTRDAEVTRLIQAGRECAEHEAGIYVMPQLVRLSAEAWPDTLCFRLGPVRSIQAVQYWDGAAWSTLSDTAYVGYRRNGSYHIDPVSAWPSLGFLPGDRIRVDLNVGYASADAVPACVKTFIVAQVGAWAENPEAAGQKLEVNPLLCRLLEPVSTYA